MTNRLNNTEPTMNFIYELENNNTFPFLDILQININKLEFIVHPKSTNKMKMTIYIFTHIITLK